MGYMLETRGLTKRFGRGDQAQDAVVDVSLHIREGEVYGLLGPNGAGKSTTLKMICGMLRPTAGEILFAGHAWRREDLYAIGSLIEDAPLYPNLTARENLRVRTTLRDARRGHGPRCRGRARGPARPNRPGASRREPRGQRRRARALARGGLLRRRGPTPRHRGVRRRAGLLSRRPRTRLRAPLHRRLIPLLARRRPPLRARPPRRLRGRERPRGLRLARQQPLGRRGGHHRGPPVQGLTTQAPHTGVPRNQTLPG